MTTKRLPRNHEKTQHRRTIASAALDLASGKDQTVIMIMERKQEEQIDAVLASAYVLGKALSETSSRLYKAVYAFGETMANLLPVSTDPNGWKATLDRAAKKLARRERYLRRYRQRSLRIKSRKARFHKARHKRF